MVERKPLAPAESLVARSVRLTPTTWARVEEQARLRGFDESLVIAEDLDFARRLRAHGKRTGRRFTTMRAAPIVASCRKFDHFGDWHMFKMPFETRQIRAAHNGTNREWVDRYFFDFNK